MPILGKENEQKVRNSDESDLKKFESLFIPPAYTEEVFAFIQNSVCRKENMKPESYRRGAYCYYQLASFDGGRKEEMAEAALENPAAVLRDVFPIRPGTSAWVRF